MSKSQIEKCKQNHTAILDIARSCPLTRAQLRFYKFLLGVSKTCPSMSVLGEIGDIPLFLKGCGALIKYWDRIRGLDEKTLVNKAYKENVQM